MTDAQADLGISKLGFSIFIPIGAEDIDVISAEAVAGAMRNF